MGIYNAIKNFNKQFEYEPKIENESKWKRFDKFVVAGMGGSHLAADLLKVWNPELDVITHQDYGLPETADLAERLIILSSYSGNTEEVLDAYKEAKEKNLSLAAVSIGGRLLEMAGYHGVPYVKMPDIGIQPRSATGFSFRAILKLIGEEKALGETEGLAYALNPTEYETAGISLATRLRGFIPVIYASRRNLPIAYNWKIKFNETSKIPAFYNAFPELNHNEMTGFDIRQKTEDVSKNFYFLILKDHDDDARIRKRTEATERLLKERKFIVEPIPLEGPNVFEKIFSSLILADWISYYLGEQYGVETEQVPMVEEFKRLIASDK